MISTKMTLESYLEVFVVAGIHDQSWEFYYRMRHCPLLKDFNFRRIQRMTWDTHTTLLPEHDETWLHSGKWVFGIGIYFDYESCKVKSLLEKLIDKQALYSLKGSKIKSLPPKLLDFCYFVDIEGLLTCE